MAVAGNLVGQVINGKYRVLSVLGEGGFGVVYKVELLLFDTANHFALKLLHPSLSQDRNFRRRFLREAGLAMSLIHENTIQIREFGQTEDGQLFFTMDFCSGEPLKSVVAREGFLNVNRAVNITRQVLSVMKLAHSRGIIHRDLKPENLFLERDLQGRDFVKVGDFGLAKSFGSGDEAARRRAWGPSPSEDISRGAILGTPRYMSPEQALGREDLDDRSDLYSIGVVLYEMLYGDVPPERLAADSAGIELRTPLPRAGHEVPPAVWEVVRKALEVPRESRYQSAEEFLKALNALPLYTAAYMEAQPRRGRLGVLRYAAVAAAASAATLAAALYFISQFGTLGSLNPFRPDRSLLRPAWEPAGVKEPLAAARASELPAGAKGPEPSSGVAEARSEVSRPPVLAPAIREYMNPKKGEEYVYRTYRNGTPQSEITYKIVDDPAPGVYTVSVTPGERTFTWVIDEKQNSFFQEFMLPDPRTGALIDPQRRLCLRLPGAMALVRPTRDYEEIRVRFDPVDLPLPKDHRNERFSDCIRVETGNEGHLHVTYYQRGNGLVGMEVFENAASLQAGAERPVALWARYLVEIRNRGG